MFETTPTIIVITNGNNKSGILNSGDVTIAVLKNSDTSLERGVIIDG